MTAVRPSSDARVRRAAPRRAPVLRRADRRARGPRPSRRCRRRRRRRPPRAGSPLPGSAAASEWSPASDWPVELGLDPLREREGALGRAHAVLREARARRRPRGRASSRSRPGAHGQCRAQRRRSRRGRRARSLPQAAGVRRAATPSSSRRRFCRAASREIRHHLDSRMRADAWRARRRTGRFRRRRLRACDLQHGLGEPSLRRLVGHPRRRDREPVVRVRFVDHELVHELSVHASRRVPASSRLPCA